MPEFTVGTWNVWEGGQKAGNTTRLEQQLALLVEHSDVDAWLIQEAMGWNANGNQILHTVADRLEMRGRFLVPSNHDGCHLAIFVRERAGLRVVRERHDRAAPWWHARAHLELDIDGRELHLMNLHLAPSSPLNRQAEAEALAVFRRWAVIAGGDLNAFPANDPRTYPDGPEDVRRKADQRAALALRASGFHDVGAALGDSSPTVGFRRPDSLPYRCDRFVSTLSPTCFTSHRVLDIDPELSDHRPVLAAFAL